MSSMRLSCLAVAATVACCCGCSTYTLEPISASDAKSAYPQAATYRVAYGDAVLVPSMQFAIGFGQPSLQLDIQEIPEIGRRAVVHVPQGTNVSIDRYVRYRQHGSYDCGADGWTFAIAHVADGKLAGRVFLIDSTALNLVDFQHDQNFLLLAPPG